MCPHNSTCPIIHPPNYTSTIQCCTITSSYPTVHRSQCGCRDATHSSLTGVLKDSPLHTISGEVQGTLKVTATMRPRSNKDAIESFVRVRFPCVLVTIAIGSRAALNGTDGVGATSHGDVAIDAIASVDIYVGSKCQDRDRQRSGRKIYQTHWSNLPAYMDCIPTDPRWSTTPRPGRW